MKAVFLSTLGVLVLSWASVDAAYLLEIDIDGMDDGVLTLNPGFSYGGDTTTASQSASASAFGLTGGDSIFGGNGAAEVDTYVFTYSPDSQSDNLVTTPGFDLGEGNLATGLTGGGAGRYAVYATWPFTENVSGGDVGFEVLTAGASFSVSIDQNGRGDAWVKVGDIDYSSGAITVNQTAGENTFVSMRGSALLFEQVPEPGTAVLVGFALAAFGFRRRR
jgi:hypothetical protein